MCRRSLWKWRITGPLKRTLLGCCALVWLMGCSSRQGIHVAVTDYYNGNFQAAREELRPLADKTDQDFVLNNVRLGSACLPDYHLDEAEGAFLKAYEVINSVGVNNGGRSLGAVLVDEKIKIWKGEPFERAMANFYLGMIYYMRHDYNNARAAMENAIFKVSDESTQQQHDNRFALAHIMLGRCWQRLGRDDLARKEFDAVQGLASFEPHAKSNVLLVVDYGYGPRKVTDFDGSIVGFAPQPYEAGPVPPPRVMVDGRMADVYGDDRPPDDLLAMAQDRKWQSIDTIRAVKSALGTGLIVAGGVEGVRGLNEHGSSQRRDLLTSAALLGAGALLKATSQADIRQWEMLPRTTFLLPLNLPPGRHDIDVVFPTGVHQLWQGLEAPSQGDATYYFRMIRWMSGPFRWGEPQSPIAQGQRTGQS